MNGKLYYIVEGGAVARTVEKFLSDRKSMLDRMMEFLGRYGAKQAFWGSDGIKALILEKAPKGWVRSKHGGWKPDHRTGEGRLLIKTMNGIRNLGCRELQAAVLGQDNVFFFMEGLTCKFMALEVIGKKRILIVPDVSPRSDIDVLEQVTGPCWVAPAGLRQIKTSEFYALKEAHASEKGGVA